MEPDDNSALTLSIADLRAAYACDLDERIADITAHLGRTPAEDEPVLAQVWWSLNSTSTMDAVWSLRCAQPAVAAAATSIAVASAAARSVAHLLPEADAAPYAARLLAARAAAAADAAHAYAAANATYAAAYAAVAYARAAEAAEAADADAAYADAVVRAALGLP